MQEGFLRHPYWFLATIKGLIFTFSKRWLTRSITTDDHTTTFSLPKEQHIHEIFWILKSSGKKDPLSDLFTAKYNNGGIA